MTTGRVSSDRLNPVSRALTWPFLALIRLYQITLSPLLGPVCRYHPSCSRYAYEAIAVHGVVVGTTLAGRRLLRCNPWMPGGLDAVPPRGGIGAYRRQQRAERRERVAERWLHRSRAADRATTPTVRGV